METARDYFIAHFEDGGLVMEPYCSCGEALNEDYFCTVCGRQCTCIEVRCKDREAFDLMETLIRENPRFKNFRAILIQEW
jgi:hypothetical protein